MSLVVLTKRPTVFLGIIILLSLLTGCAGGGNTADVHNPPPPPPAKQVSITFQPAPTGSVQLGTLINFSAVVSNDATNAGVDWNVTCQTPKCGSFSAVHTASGETTVYTPPSTLAGNVFTANVEAFATADHNQNVIAPVTVTAFGSNLSGTYILQAQGLDSISLQPYQFTAAVVLDGNGHITSGEQAVNVVDQTLGTLATKLDAVTDGSYFLGPDGRGIITIKTNDQAIGISGTETFNFVYLSTSQGFITQTDSTASASGTMDLQTNVAGLSGGYAFVASGMDVLNGVQTAFGGVFNVDSPNTISGAGSISDQNLAGTLTQNQPLSGTVSNPDSFGVVTIDLAPAFALGPIEFLGFIVDSTHIKLIETDNVGGVGTSSTAGLAIAQGTATGTFKGVSSFSGTYVYGLLGEDVSSGIPSTMTSVGMFTADGAGNLSNGFTDTFLQSNCVEKNCIQDGIPGAQVSTAFGGTYAMALNGIGRNRVIPGMFSSPPSPVFRTLLIFYLTGNGNPALVLGGGDLSSTQNYPSLGIGIAYPRANAPFTLNGTYGLTLTQQNGTESDAIAELSATASSGTLSGILDNDVVSDTPFSGTFGDPGPTGRFAAALTGTAFEFTSPATSSFAAEFYAIDSGHGFLVETDLIDTNAPSATVSFGYYAARTPVCAGCP